MEAISHRVPGSDGLKLHLLEWSREGVPFLLLHGFSNEAHVWDDLVPALAAHYRVLALDQRGHGDSDADPEGRYDHATMARDVAAVCDALGLERLVLCGHSMGGRVALHFAGSHPERLAGLVVVDAGPDLDQRGVSRITTEAVRQEPVFASRDQYAALLSRNYPAARPAAIARMARHELREREDGRFELKLRLDMAKLRAGRSETEAEAYRAEESERLWKILRSVACPTLVVRGAASDVLSPDTADAMEEALAKGRLEVIPRAGHSVMVDAPDAFREALTRFALA